MARESLTVDTDALRDAVRDLARIASGQPPRPRWDLAATHCSALADGAEELTYWAAYVGMRATQSLGASADAARTVADTVEGSDARLAQAVGSR